jgi:hypothetical protein
VNVRNSSFQRELQQGAFAVLGVDLAVIMEDDLGHTH